MFTNMSIYVIIYLCTTIYILCCAGEYNMQTNGKRRRHWAGGFTLSEILITLAILGFIAALSVPMLGQQKLKKPNVSALGHGIFECYYGDDDVLYQHYADEKGTDKTEAAADGACHFTAPVANYYAITTIGAGGDGGYMNNIPYYNQTNKSTEPTSVSTGSSFYTDLHNSLPSGYDWVLGSEIEGKSYWDAAAPYNRVNYTLQAKVGKSGRSDRYLAIYSMYQNGYNICQNCLTTGSTNCPQDCFNEQPCRGGNSGRAYQANVNNVILGSNDTVSYNLNGSKNGFPAVTLKIGDKEAFVYHAPDGKDAYTTIIDGNHMTCRQGEDGETPSPYYGKTGFGSTYFSYYAQNYGASGTTGYPTYSSKPGEDAIDGVVSISPSEINISYQYLVINPKYGTSGQPGNVIMRIYEKLPKSALVAVPARDINENSVVYIQNANGQRSTLSKAAAGANGTEVNDSTKYYEVNDPADLPFPSELKDTVAPKTPDIFSAIGRSLNSKIAELAATPGTSGYGGYPFINSISASLNKRIGNRTFYGSNSTITTTETKCWDGSDPVLGYSGKYYCAATRGGKGAVKIEW